MSGDDDSIPVRLVVNGTIYDDPNDDYPRPFHHNYEFVNFQPGDDLPFGDEVFEVITRISVLKNYSVNRAGMLRKCDIQMYYSVQ